MGDDGDSNSSSDADPETEPLLEGQLITNSDDSDNEIRGSDGDE